MYVSFEAVSIQLIKDYFEICLCTKLLHHEILVHRLFENQKMVIFVPGAYFTGLMKQEKILNS